jgi:hypothetical protein
MRASQGFALDEHVGSPSLSAHMRSGAALIGRVILAVALLSTLAVGLFFFGRDYRYFTFLSNAFIHGTFSVNNLPTIYFDRVTVGSSTYLSLAPMPGILLVPLVSIFGTAFDEVVLAYPATAANILLMLLLLKRIGIAREMRQWLMVLFFCGTIYFSVFANGRSWLLAHIIAITFLLLAINEVLSRRRVPLIGLWLGLAFLTRSLTIFALPFFVLLLAPSGKSRFRQIAPVGLKLAVGLAIPTAFFLYYNYARFGNPFETGYGLAQTGNGDLVAALKLGLFSVAHIPKNLYALLLAGPQPYPGFSAPALEFPYLYPSPWGLSIFLTTPAFVYAFAANWHERLVRASWLAVGLVLLPLMFYYGNGWVQFGYRYALDFYPFLFILTALGIAKNFDRRTRVLILVSVLINLWGALWEVLGYKIFPVL